MAMTKGGSVPNAGDGSVPGGYGAPTPHQAVIQQAPYQAPTSGDATGGEGEDSGRQFPTGTPAAFDANPPLPLINAGPGQFSGGVNAATAGIVNAGDNPQFPVKTPSAFSAMENGLGQAKSAD